MIRVAVLVICLCLGAQDSLADSPFHLDQKRDWILIGGGAAFGVAGMVMYSRIDPLTPDEIANLDVNDINSFDRDAVSPYRETEAGDALLYASYLLPFTFLAQEQAREDWKTLGVLWVETMALQLGINGFVKSTVLRTRPYVYDPDTPMDKKTSAKARVSFYSGHTSTTAANCFFVARVFHEYFTSRRAKVLLWTGAAIYPALTGYLRRDSGHHWRTDVITGYAVGALIGFLVPQLHLSFRDGNISARPVSISGGTGLALQVAF